MYRILACGSNGNCQLGVGDAEDRDVLELLRFQGEYSIRGKPKKISCGGNHTLILLESGEIFTAGENTQGQCCCETDGPKVDHLCEFQEMLKERKWKDVSAGWEFSVLVDSHDQIWTVGNGASGELGHGKSIEDMVSKRVRKLGLNKEGKYKVVKIESSIHNTIVLLVNKQDASDRKVFGWGNNKKGQLAELILENGKPINKILWEPVELTQEKGWYTVDFSISRDFTVFKTQNTSTNEIRFKLMGKDNFNISQELASYRFDINVSFKSMWSSIHCVYENKIVSMGNNSHGQKYSGTSSDFNSIQPLEMNFDFEVGSEHGLLLSNRRKLYAWGWGEHGNCGPLPKQNDVVFKNLNLLYTCSPDREIVMIKGGNATTWVVERTTDTTK